jgi:hypothetical protein
LVIHIKICFIFDYYAVSLQEMSILLAEFFSWGNSSNLFLPHEIGIFHLVKFLLSTKFWTNFARWNFSSQLELMKLTPLVTLPTGYLSEAPRGYTKK